VGLTIDEMIFNDYTAVIYEWLKENPSFLIKSLSLFKKSSDDILAKHSAGFMSGSYCQKGSIGAEYKKTMAV
jgi:hypothetical protein